MSNRTWLALALCIAGSGAVGCSDDDDSSGVDAGAGDSPGSTGGQETGEAGSAGEAEETAGGTQGGAEPVGGAATQLGGDAGSADDAAAGSAGTPGSGGAPAAAGEAGEGGSAGGSEPGGAAAQAGSGTIETQGATVELACPTAGAGCDAATSASVAATSLYACNYWDSTRSLHVEFRAGDAMSRIELYLADFTGDGTYEASADGGTDVVVVGGDVPSAATASGPPLRDCTIAVTSNFTEIEVPEIGDAPILNLAFEVVCPSLSAGGICEVTCDVSPATFELSVQGCVVSQ